MAQSRDIVPVPVPVPEDKRDEKPVEVENDRNGANPVTVTVLNAGQPGTTDVYIVPGPDGRPRLFVPADMQLVATRSGAYQQGTTAEADSVPIHELTVSTRVSELDARGRG